MPRLVRDTVRVAASAAAAAAETKIRIAGWCERVAHETLSHAAYEKSKSAAKVQSNSSVHILEQGIEACD